MRLMCLGMAMSAMGLVAGVGFNLGDDEESIGGGVNEVEDNGHNEDAEPNESEAEAEADAETSAEDSDDEDDEDSYLEPDEDDD